MIEIEVQKIPNQEFIKELDGHRYKIKIRTFHGLTLMDVDIDDVNVKHSVRVCPNVPIIPYDYTTQGGNLVFVCNDNNYPNYELFGVTQQLVYLTDAELQEINANAS